jgi:hypothetical protein
MGTAIQVCGALLILVPFVLVQLGRTTPRATAYLVLNLAGGLVLAVDAFLEEQWGFTLLQSAWALVAAVGLLRR